MGNKKGSRQQHVQQSMAQMVSTAALARMAPSIQGFVEQMVRQLGSQLATQQASTLETLFSRVVVLETIVIEKLGLTKEDLAMKVSELEDSKEGMTLVEGPIELDDLVRLQVKTKAADQKEYQGESHLKLYKAGSGQTIGEELEQALIGMKAGETKTVEFGEKKDMVAEFTINRVSRSSKPKQVTDGGVEEMTAGIQADEVQSEASAQG
jgi:hypothetical protein